MLPHPEGHPIAVDADTDCDGTSIGYFDCEHVETTRLPYDRYTADIYITREEFEQDICHTPPRGTRATGGATATTPMTARSATARSRNPDLGFRSSARRSADV